MNLSNVILVFNVFLPQFVNYIVANASHLNIPPAQVTILQGHLTAWGIKFTAYITPATHNTASINDINTLYSTISAYTDNTKQQIKNDQNVTLNGDDYLN